MSRCGCSLNLTLASALDFHIPEMRQEEGVQQSGIGTGLLLGIPGKLGKWLNGAILATQTSPGPQFSSSGCRPEGIGPVERGLTVPGSGSRQGGHGSSNAFERQARTIGLKRPLLVASGKTEPKWAGPGPTADCTFPDHTNSPLALVSSFPSPPVGQNSRVCKPQQVIQVCVSAGSCLTAPGLRLSCVIKGKHLSHRGSHLG